MCGQCSASRDILWDVSKALCVPDAGSTSQLIRAPNWGSTEGQACYFGCVGVGGGRGTDTGNMTQWDLIQDAAITLPAIYMWHGRNHDYWDPASDLAEKNSYSFPQVCAI